MDPHRPSSPGLLALRERQRMVAAAWLWSLFAAYLGLAVPWFLRVVELDLGPISWSVFAFAAVYVALTLLAERLPRRRLLIAVAALLELGGMAFLGWMWHLAGGLEMPGFLLVFALPILAAAAGPLTAQPYLTALAAILVVGAVAWIESAELRFYLLQLGLPLRSLAELETGGLAAARDPFGRFEATPPYAFATLVLFAVLSAAAAVVAAALEPLYRALADPIPDRSAAGESLPLAALRATSDPTALVEVESARVVEASDSFFERLLLDRAQLRHRDLFELIRFETPEPVAHRLAGDGGEVPLVLYRVGRGGSVAERDNGKPSEERAEDERTAGERAGGERQDGERAGTELRVASVRVDRLPGGRYAVLALRELDEHFYLRAAFDALDEAWIVIGTDGRLVYFNAAAERLLGSLYLGLEASALPDPGAAAADWWRADTGERHRLERTGRVLQARVRAARLPGQQRRLTLVSLDEEGA